MTLMHFEVSVLALSISCAHSALNASNTVKFGYSMILKPNSPMKVTVQQQQVPQKKLFSFGLTFAYLGPGEQLIDARDGGKNSS